MHCSSGGLVNRHSQLGPPNNACMSSLSLVRNLAMPSSWTTATVAARLLQPYCGPNDLYKYYKRRGDDIRLGGLPSSLLLRGR